ncbi:hypothetical protein [Virgisporangium aurantiacum]|uniref:Ricin B lectin domain-containing protein n=1 Tax=Virgisporangium aurantiacum TaxID=175570 RepID=A0A8J3Z0V3_9ACTN|nr:hypothetical protein [Virgisporangium aurantiacum]GIJ54243.1 hypothetical protein Vau01_017590 [Virgisporangium aurantiacum]
MLAALVLTLTGSVVMAGSANADVPGTAFRSIRNNAWGQCASTTTAAAGSHVLLGTCDTGYFRNWVRVPTGQANTIDVCSASPTQTWVQLPDLKLLHFGTGLCLDTVSNQGSELMQWFCGQEAPVGVQSWTINA